MSEVKLFKTSVLGMGPFCIEFPDGEIVTTRSEHRQRDIADTQALRDENTRLRANLINCAARLEAYYGEDYPAVRDAKNALDGGKGVQGAQKG